MLIPLAWGPTRTHTQHMTVYGPGPNMDGGVYPHKVKMVCMSTG